MGWGCLYSVPFNFEEICDNFILFFKKKLTVDVPKLPGASHLEPEEGVIASFLDNAR